MRRKFTRRTKGFNAQVFVVKAINYTTDATIGAFVDNAPEGELGVYDANNALHDNAITAAESFCIAMKMSDGNIKKTPLLKLSEVSVSKKAYVAPVKQVSAIGWTGTGGSLNAGTVAARDNFELAIIETTEGFDPFPTWNFVYQAKTGDAQIDVVLALAKDINNPNAQQYKNNEPLVTAAVKADATYSNAALTGTTPTLTFTKGSTAVVLGGTGGPTHNFAAGEYLSVAAGATPDDAIGNIYKVVAAVAGTGFTLDRPYEGATQTFSEAEAEGTRIKKAATFVAVGLVFTTIDNDVHFRIAVRERLEDATITYVTPYTKGVGTYEEVREDEIEGEIFEGDTAINSEFADKFGKQVVLSAAGETYDCYNIKYTKRKANLAPHDEMIHNGNIVLWVAKSSGDADTNLDTLFGL